MDKNNTQLDDNIDRDEFDMLAILDSHEIDYLEYIQRGNEYNTISQIVYIIIGLTSLHLSGFHVLMIIPAVLFIASLVFKYLVTTKGDYYSAKIELKDGKLNKKNYIEDLKELIPLNKSANVKRCRYLRNSNKLVSFAILIGLGILTLII